MEEAGLHYTKRDKIHEGLRDTRVFAEDYGDGIYCVGTENDIDRGTMICMESALMSFDGDADYIDVYTAYLDLDSKYQQMYDKFPLPQGYDIDVIVGEIYSLFLENPDKASRFPELIYSPESLKVVATTWARFSYKSRIRPGTNIRDVPKMISLMKHSCKPNAALSYNSSRGMWGVYAMDDIPAEGEIFISFVDPVLPLEQRKKALRGKGIQRCHCTSCHFEPGCLASVEVDLEIIQDLRQHAEEAHPNRLKQLRIYEEMLRTLRLRPELSEYQCKVHEIVAKLYSKDPDTLGQAFTNVEIAIALATRCYGQNGDITLSLIQLSEDIDAGNLRIT